MPGLARDSHALKMDGVVERALEQAGLASAAEVDAVAVTVSVWVVCLFVFVCVGLCVLVFSGGDVGPHCCFGSVASGYVCKLLSLMPVTGGLWCCVFWVFGVESEPRWQLKMHVRGFDASCRPGMKANAFRPVSRPSLTFFFVAVKTSLFILSFPGYTSTTRCHLSHTYVTGMVREVTESAGRP